MKNSSVDQEEILKFANIADQWWDENGKLKILHRFNHTRIEFISQNLRNINSNDTTILDIGCGGGLLSESFAKKGYIVTGLDAEKKTINQAKAHAIKENINIEYLLSSPEDFIETSNKQFDVIFAMEIIEHVTDPLYFVETIVKALKPNGLIFFSTINRNIKSILLAKFMAEYVLQWLPRGTHNFNKFITPLELNNIFHKTNISLEAISGINYNIFSQKWLLSNKPTVNYICAGRKNI